LFAWFSGAGCLFNLLINGALVEVVAAEWASYQPEQIFLPASTPEPEWQPFLTNDYAVAYKAT
jgi:hypothetical protein